MEYSHALHHQTFYSGQKKKLSAPKQVRDFPNMIKIQNFLGPIGPTSIKKIILPVLDQKVSFFDHCIVIWTGSLPLRIVTFSKHMQVPHVVALTVPVK